MTRKFLRESTSRSIHTIMNEFVQAIPILNDVANELGYVIGAPS